MNNRASAAKLSDFVALHQAEVPFVIPNAWNAGSARILTALGFEAVATTSAGLAFSIGLRDSTAALSREQVLDNAAEIVSATQLPVSADLEDGFGTSPDDCASTISAAIEVGLVGGTVEDATGDPSDPIYEFAHAAARIEAACEAAGDKFLVTARAENFLYGRHDLDETIRRLQAFEAVGAHVLYAPGLPDLDAIRTVCSAVGRPVNVVMGLSGPSYSVSELAQAGVKRISTGGSLARAALGGFARAAQEIRDSGTFKYATEAMSDSQASAFMSPTKHR